MAEYIEREFNPCDVCDYKRCSNCILHELAMKFVGHPAADVAPVVKELRPVVRLLHKEYEAATKNPIVRDPLAYALYQVWKAVNGKNGR